MQLPKTQGKILILLLFTLLLIISTAMAVSRARKRQVTNEKTKGPTTMVEFHTKDFSERGIYLVGPSNPLFAKMAAQLTKSKESSVNDLPPYSVFLKNGSSRTVIGYRITWECG